MESQIRTLPSSASLRKCSQVFTPVIFSLRELGRSDTGLPRAHKPPIVDDNHPLTSRGDRSSRSSILNLAAA
jgi:hypothetical protein